MSNVYRPQDDYRNWWNLGGIVEFDAPDGRRLTGEIVRSYPNGAMHVEVDGTRYEVSQQTDNAHQVGGW